MRTSWSPLRKILQKRAQRLLYVVKSFSRDSGLQTQVLICNTTRTALTRMLLETASLFAGEPPRRAGKYVPKFLPPSMAAALAAPESKPNFLEVPSKTCRDAFHLTLLSTIAHTCCSSCGCPALTSLLQHVFCSVRDAAMVMSCSQLCCLCQRLPLVAKANNPVKLMPC